MTNVNVVPGGIVSINMYSFAKKPETITEKQKTLEEQLKYQKRLNNIVKMIHSAKNTNDILLNLQGEILSLFNAERITVYVVNKITRKLESRLKSGEEITEISVPVNNCSIAGYCVKSGKIVNVSDAYDQHELSRINPQLRFNKSWDETSDFITVQVLAVPIMHNSHRLGAIQLINKRGGRRFTQEDQVSILDIAEVLGVAFFKNEKVKAEIHDFLVDGNVNTRNEIADAMSLSKQKKCSVEAVLMADFQVSKDDVGKSLSDFYETEFIPFDPKMPIPGQLLRGLSPIFLKKNTFVPISQIGDTVVVAMEKPDLLPEQDIVNRYLKSKKIKYCVSVREDIYKMVDQFFDVKTADKSSSSGSIEDILGQLSPVDDEEDDFDSMAEDDSAIVKLVNKMIVDAHNRGASDIHIEPRSGKKPAVIRIRIDGACRVYQTIPHTYKRALVSRIKIMSDLDISERRLPQDGKIKFRRFAPLDIELRVATVPTAGRNEDVVMRLLTAGEPQPLNKMGMTQRDCDGFINIITKPYGMVLVVGPTGSGKTTTLHAAMRHINNPETKIWTAEDPVEITQDGLRQVQVHPKIGLTFASAMRAFLRADPDVIMVGEMRDHETVSTGIEASLTGHLVLSTLHTNSAPETITRLLDMGMDPFNFADALLGVLAQRLTRTLCNKCKEKYHPERDEYDALVRLYNGDFDALGFEYNDDFFLYRAKGCRECSKTGYRGRTGLFELLLGTEEMKQLIQNRVPIDEIRKQAVRKENMTTLMQDGIRKVCLGLTDIKQVRRVCIR